MIIQRRSFLIGLLAAPAIVRFSSLMPIKALGDHVTDMFWPDVYRYEFIGLTNGKLTLPPAWMARGHI